MKWGYSRKKLNGWGWGGGEDMELRGIRNRHEEFTGVN